MSRLFVRENAFKKCTLLTTENGIVGIIRYQMTLNGRQFFKSKMICTRRQDMVSNLEPLIEEALLPEILTSKS